MADFLANFTFLRPWWLLAIVPVVAVWIGLRKNQDPSQLYSGLVAPHLLKYLLIGPEHRAGIRPSQVLLILCTLLVVAVAGPSWRPEPSPFAEEKAGLMILLKVSPSMKAQDLQPSRLERARQKLHDFFKVRTGGTTGLIAYSGSAHLVMPLTKDTRIIEQMAQSVNPSVMPIDGDALGDALVLAKKQFEKADTYGSVLVITDGIDVGQISSLTKYGKEGGLPVQILATVINDAAAYQQGIDRGAGALDAPVQLVTVDDSDMRRIAARAESMVSTVAAEKSGTRPRDEGYALVPVIALGILLWARRGWSIRWE